ncbi:division/cell wall cluster transcriptional repressor MraZ [Sinimarinibacterium sp. NLF-5-8]|uniref:division/cell wall cluster transcriptional repressor MraZ n=1 Tax=Sinimarinibacterium sp. NLF-5-8 TaxID=2698684 RepID=UPI00137C0103|nr:division/cell wall cluster transcriptional repressor MraZ [Sinimarinibacterium sp. NLF-5-8]QHS10269.1 division/cell wall cluster transcriptional repressor MraZ [Sinimarinibacterium sp. NLF-5-8]
MFKGVHHLAVDEKGRLAIPARFRLTLAEQCESQLVVTIGPNPCLEIYPLPEFERIVRDIQAMEDRDQAEALKQWFVGFASDAEIDRQGRILLPPMLRRRVQIDGAAVLMGQDSRFDLWPEAEWERRFGEAIDRTPTLADAFRSIRR